MIPEGWLVCSSCRNKFTVRSILKHGLICSDSIRTRACHICGCCEFYFPPSVSYTSAFQVAEDLLGNLYAYYDKRELAFELIYRIQDEQLGYTIGATATKGATHDLEPDD